MECWERCLGEGCFLNLAFKDKSKKERWPSRRWPRQGKWGWGWRNGTHSHSRSSPQTHPNLPGAAPWPSHSGWWGWPGLWRQGSWTRRWIMPLSSSEGRRSAEGLQFLGSHRLPAGFLWESEKSGKRSQTSSLTHCSPPGCFQSLLNYYVLFWRGMHNLYLIPRKHQTSQTEGTSRK